MSIITGILAIIGKILLAVLLFVLFLLVLVLAVPFRYRFGLSGSTEASEIHIRAGVTWFFGAVSFLMYFDRTKDRKGKGLIKELRFFGVSPSELKKARRKKKTEEIKEAKKERIEKIRKEDPGRYQRMKEEAKAKKAAREEERRRREAEEAARREREREELMQARERKERMRIRALHSIGFFERLLRAVRSALIDCFGLIYTLLFKICFLPVRISDFFLETGQKLLDFEGNALGLLAFLTDPRTSGALRVLIRTLKKAAAHIVPGGPEGELSFGLPDPARMGELTGILAVICPASAPGLSLFPVFGGETLYAAGDAAFRGRVRLGYLAYLAAAAFADRDIRYMIHLYKEHKEEEHG